MVRVSGIWDMNVERYVTIWRGTIRTEVVSEATAHSFIIRMRSPRVTSSLLTATSVFADIPSTSSRPARFQG
ncbi:MAG: hypothetical protein ACE5QF_09295 [Thermoplasmata archaeon]